MLSSMVREKQTQHGQYGQQAKLYVRSEEPLHERTIRAEDFYCLKIPVAPHGSGYSPMPAAGIVFDDGNRDHITRIGNDGRGTDKPEFHKCHIVRVNRAGAGVVSGLFSDRQFSGSWWCIPC